MRIGLIVDGVSEFRSLPYLMSQLPINYTFVPLKANVHPLASIERLVASLSLSLRILKGKKIKRAVVLLDYENRQGCVGDFASDLRRRLCKLNLMTKIDVVIKNRKYENWLVADVDMLSSNTKYTLSNNDKSAIEPDKADHVDAVKILEKLTHSNYDKVRDSCRICKKARPLLIAKNSRSFRRLLRVVGCPTYAAQSKMPQ